MSGRGYVWVDPEGRRSRPFGTVRDAWRSAVLVYVQRLGVQAQPGGAPGRAVPAPSDVPWSRMKDAGWRIEDVDEVMP